MRRRTSAWPSTAAISGSSARGAATRDFDLDDRPELAALVDTIRGTLAGDLTLLQKTYEVSLDGTQAAWRLTLTPHDAAVARFIRSVRIDGADAVVKQIETVQTDGGTDRLTITPG